jgi:hypothetical protein
MAGSLGERSDSINQRSLHLADRRGDRSEARR